MAKGQKLCTECQEPTGCRTKICKCGHVFGGSATATGKQGSNNTTKQPKPTKKKKSTNRKVKQTKHPLGQVYLPATGLWVFDLPSGMPGIHAPDDLPSGPLSNQHVYDETVYHGLGECVQIHIPSRRIADPKLRKLWKKADEALDKVWGYLIDDDEPKSTT